MAQMDYTPIELKQSVRRLKASLAAVGVTVAAAADDAGATAYRDQIGRLLWHGGTIEIIPRPHITDQQTFKLLASARAQWFKINGRPQRPWVRVGSFGAVDAYMTIVRESDLYARIPDVSAISAAV